MCVKNQFYKHFLLFIQLFLLSSCFSQQKMEDNIRLKLFLESKAELDSNSVHTNKNIIDYPEIPAQYKDGEKKLEQLILDNISIKKKHLLKVFKKQESKVIQLEFSIDNQGKIENLSLIKGIDKKIDAEILRIIPLGDWCVGEKQGEKVNSFCKLEIQFL
jgi:hypothetical protein